MHHLSWVVFFVHFFFLVTHRARETRKLACARAMSRTVTRIVKLTDNRERLFAGFVGFSTVGHLLARPCCILPFFMKLHSDRPFDCMRAEYWPIVWQLEDALRANMWQCNNACDDKKKNKTKQKPRAARSSEKIRPKIAISYVSVYQTNTNMIN